MWEKRQVFGTEEFQINYVNANYPQPLEYELSTMERDWGRRGWEVTLQQKNLTNTTPNN